MTNFAEQLAQALAALNVKTVAPTLIFPGEKIGDVPGLKQFTVEAEEAASAMAARIAADCGMTVCFHQLCLPTDSTTLKSARQQHENVLVRKIESTTRVFIAEEKEFLQRFDVLVRSI